MVYAIHLSNATRSVSGIPGDVILQLLSIPLCHPLSLQRYIPFTGAKPTDDNFEPLSLGLRSECMDLIWQHVFGIWQTSPLGFSRAGSVSAFLTWKLYQDLSEFGKSEILSWCFAQWSVKSFCFLLSQNPMARAVAMGWQSPRTLQEVAVLTWAGRVSAANGSPSKGWITASVCSEHKKLMYSEEEIKKAFPPKEGISYLPHPEVHNSLSAIEFQQHRAAGEQQLTAQSLTRSLCFQPLSRCLPLALPLLVLKPVTAECSN